MFEIIIKSSDVIRGSRSIQGVSNFRLTAFDKDGDFIEIRNGKVVNRSSEKVIDQEKTMKKYLEILELRAAIDKIDLT